MNSDRQVDYCDRIQSLTPPEHRHEINNLLSIALNGPAVGMHAEAKDAEAKINQILSL